MIAYYRESQEFKVYPPAAKILSAYYFINCFTSKGKIKMSRKERELDIPQAAQFLGIKVYYMRKMLREGRIPSRHEPINDKGQWKHMIKVSDLQHYAAHKGRKRDGKVIQKTRMNAEELELANEALAAAGLPLLSPNYVSKANRNK